MAQLVAARERLRRDNGLDLRVVAVAGRRQMWFECDDPLLHTRTDGAQIWRPMDLDQLVEHTRGAADHAVVIDCSASAEVAARYPSWLERRVHVVTPNKHAVAGSTALWRAIHHASRQSGAQVRYEATVGAGLPVVQTLRDLIQTGDTLVRAEGMLSGTLAWLLAHFDGATPFSALVRRAHALGITEPDPRADLSGEDVARKLVILAREAGWALSVEDVAVANLVPESLRTVPLDAFWARLEEMDAGLTDRLEQARAASGVLRYVALLRCAAADDRAAENDSGGAHQQQVGDPSAPLVARVDLTTVAADHALARTQHTDNIVRFSTHRYATTPLVVQGPGAGPEVTAAGVFADVLRVCEGLR